MENSVYIAIGRNASAMEGAHQQQVLECNAWIYTCAFGHCISRGCPDSLLKPRLLLLRLPSFSLAAAAACPPSGAHLLLPEGGSCPTARSSTVSLALASRTTVQFACAWHG